MKAKTARRRLRSNAWKMAREARSLCSYKGLGKKWKDWTMTALSTEPTKAPIKVIPDKAKVKGPNVTEMIRKMMEIRSPKAVKPEILGD